MATHCPKCKTENSSDSKYCKECATALPYSEDVQASFTKTLETPIQPLTKGTFFANRYEVIEKLGKGGMGEVYRVKDVTLDEEMALKILKPEITAHEGTIERFKNELKLARRIAHRNVCKMYDLHEEGDTPFITMEYVKGEDLKSLIKRKEKLPEKEVIALAKQVCEGLVEAHELGVIHRDLKPQNIMVDDKGVAKVMDFGIARSVEAAGVTQTGVMIGTPDYISPEQAEGQEADHRSDIYSLGVILYEMVTGTLPFRGDTALSVALKHKAQLPQDPRKLNTDVSENLSRLILICMEKARERRYQTAEALLNDLQNIEEGLPLGTKIRPRRETFIQTLIRNKLFIPASIVALAVIAVVIWQPWSKKAPPPLPSGKPSLAVVYFENNTGDESLDYWRKALSELLIADISQSKYIDVLSGDRLFTLLRELGLLEAKTYSSEDLSKIAIQGGANHILRGNYTKAGDSFRINAMVQNVSTSELIGSERVEGTGEQSFFSMVDELTRRIKTQFKLSEEQISSDIDREVGKITTSSLEAFNYYIEAKQYFETGDYRKSLEYLEKAVAIDPEFASAYRKMAAAYSNLFNDAEMRKYAQKAFELVDRVSDRERYQIQGNFYFSSQKTWDKAIEAYKHLLEIYPDDYIGNSGLGLIYLCLEDWDNAKERYQVSYEIAIQTKRDYSPLSTGNLALSYMAKGLYDKATEVLKEYLSQASENPVIHEYLTDCYLCQGKYDLAEAAAEKTFSLNPHSPDIFIIYPDILYLKGELERAEREYQKLFESEEKYLHIAGREKLAALYLLKGQFEKAKEQLEKGAELSAELGMAEKRGKLHLELAYIHLKLENPADALKELDKCWNILLEIDNIMGQTLTMFFKGLTSVKQESLDKAGRTSDELKELIENGLYRKNWRYYYHLLGLIELEKGNFSGAIDNFNKALSYLSSQWNPLGADEHALFIEPLALAYYESGDIDKALAEYERITKLTSGRLFYGDIYAKSFYMLGKIYEEKGLKVKAIEHYEKFLDLWKDADPGIAEVDDARKRLANLT